MEMEVVILAGGYGSRMGSATENLPKPMITLGGKPILLHIIDYYLLWGANRFIICCGYKMNCIQSFFADRGYQIDCASDLDVVVKYRGADLILADTGLDSGTAQRVVRVKEHISGEHFFLTYGDGLSDVDLDSLLNVHLDSDAMATITAVHPKERFGVVRFDNDHRIVSFQEKAQRSDMWINGGFMALKSAFFEKVSAEDQSLEYDCFPRLAAEHAMAVYCHTGFWQCMDTIDERNTLEALVHGGQAPWIKKMGEERV